MKSFSDFIHEGVNDPAIFKAIFLAGGPGSGKSFIVKNTALIALGFKIIDSDAAFEVALKKSGLPTIPDNIYSPYGQELRHGAKMVTRKKMYVSSGGRLGLAIDGTGKDYGKIKKQVEELRELGYDVAMIFVNTDLKTARARNAARPRKIKDSHLKDMWTLAQTNIGHYQKLFRDKIFIVDNSDGSNWKGAVLSVYKKIAAWIKEPPRNPIARAWIASQK